MQEEGGGRREERKAKSEERGARSEEGGGRGGEREREEGQLTPETRIALGKAERVQLEFRAPRFFQNSAQSEEEHSHHFEIEIGIFSSSLIFEFWW
jgi:hypothetical protein